MMRVFGDSRFCAALALASMFLVSSCLASNLELDASAQAHHPAELQSEPATRAAMRAIHPGKMRVSRDAATATLRVVVTVDPCKPDGFVYEQNSLAVEIDHAARIVTLKGKVQYIKHGSIDAGACATIPEPIVLVSEPAPPEPYLIRNVSAWIGRGGNGLKARVLDFRTPARIEADEQACRSEDATEIGNISGIWFLQSDPSKALSVSANESTMTPNPVLPTWTGSGRPWVIEADAPYTFNHPPLGIVKFQSATCAIVYTPLTGEQSDVLIRQTVDER